MKQDLFLKPFIHVDIGLSPTKAVLNLWTGKAFWSRGSS